jgi:organic radical activating enzyme
MDPNLKPDPDHLQQVGWLWAMLGALLAWSADKLSKAAGYFMRRHNDNDDRKDDLLKKYEEALRAHSVSSAQKYAELELRLELRLTRIEAREPITEKVLREVVRQAMDDITKQFRPEHDRLSTELSEVKKEVKDCAIDINKRVTALTLQLHKLPQIQEEDSS